ncbi:MAG: Uma2 family endonuclease [Bacteroidota bacterium]
MSVLLLIDRMTAEEFLEREFNAEERHEYNNGKIAVIAYASDNHELIVANVVRELGNYAKDTDYRVYPSNRMLHVPEKARFYYADAMIVKGKSEFFNYKKKMKATLNPYVIIEVLSDSTEGKDRGEKWQAYRTIPSLKEYILIAQNQVYVEIFKKVLSEKGEELWLNESHEYIEKSISIADQAIPMAEIYRDVEFEEKEEENDTKSDGD